MCRDVGGTAQPRRARGPRPQRWPEADQAQPGAPAQPGGSETRFRDCFMLLGAVEPEELLFVEVTAVHVYRLEVRTLCSVQ